MHVWIQTETSGRLRERLLRGFTLLSKFSHVVRLAAALTCDREYFLPERLIEWQRLCVPFFASPPPPRWRHKSACRRSRSAMDSHGVLSIQCRREGCRRSTKPPTQESYFEADVWWRRVYLRPCLGGLLERCGVENVSKKKRRCVSRSAEVMLPTLTSLARRQAGLATASASMEASFPRRKMDSAGRGRCMFKFFFYTATP